LSYIDFSPNQGGAQDGRSLAYRLRIARLEQGLTLREAARVTGIDKTTICAIENNKRNPFGITLSRLAKGYGIAISELIESLDK
jgi:transcriptional regulator with XRE-family HTH domain